jgi:hypothetical protein
LPNQKPETSVSGTSPVYSIEARLIPSFKQPPREENGMMLDGEWRRVNVSPSPIGVPDKLLCADMARANGFVSHVSAMALAWWFLAECDQYGGVEVRIVEHVYEYSYSIKRRGEGESITKPGLLYLKPVEATDA